MNRKKMNDFFIKEENVCMHDCKVEYDSSFDHDDDDYYHNSMHDWYDDGSDCYEEEKPNPLDDWELN